MNGSEGRRESPPLMRMPPCGRESGGTKAGLGGMRREGLWLSLSMDMALLGTGAGADCHAIYGADNNNQRRCVVMSHPCWSEVNIIAAMWKCYLLCMAAEYTRVAKEKGASTVYIPLPPHYLLLCTVIRLLPMTCGEIETESRIATPSQPRGSIHSTRYPTRALQLRFSYYATKLRFCLRSPIPPQLPTI